MQTKHWIALASAAALVVGCAAMAPGPSDAEVRAKAAEVMKASFKDRGQAKVDRLTQDETQATCSQYAGKELPKDVAARIEQANLAAIKYPSNGQYLGLFQMGDFAWSRYGHGATAWVQARAAYRYFADSGYDWSPWECKP